MRNFLNCSNRQRINKTMKPKTPNRTSPAKTSKALIGCPSFQPRPSHAEATASFVKSHNKVTKDDAKNGYLPEFLKIAQMISENYQSFSFNEFLTLSRSLDLPAEEIATLFHEWIRQLVEDKRIRQVNGCYSFPTYHFI